MTTRATAEEEVVQRAKEEIEKKTGKTPAMLYEEREKRVRDCMELREPDRVPVLMRGGNFPNWYVGNPPSTTFYEPAVYRRAIIKTLVDFDPDIFEAPASYFNSCGLAFEALDPKQIQWPGGPLPKDYGTQFLEFEAMKEDEYDLFITDPTDFMLRRYLPRVFGAMEPFSKLPMLGNNLVGWASGFMTMTPLFSAPEFRKAARSLLKAGQERAKWREALGNAQKDIMDLGYPPYYYPGGAGGAPFDVIADYLRGLRLTLVDMFKRPEKLLRALDRILEWRLARAVPADPTKKWHPRRALGGVTHYSSDRFMSKKQFETFVWPAWKKAMLSTINMGYLIMVHGEGKNDERLEYFLELPKGKVFFRVMEGDLPRAKAILGGHACIAGHVPSILLQNGSAQEVEEHCRDMIKVCGKGGGFIINCTNLIDKPKPANVKAVMDAAKKYGRY
ncbi:MAG: hypothetical protein HY673_00320 [Chloroflexi bacterium]|nr:hypothetical protein [Chloroflexota bacterium]